MLITGGAGFIGSALSAALLRRGHGVLAVDDLSAGFQERVPVGAEFELLDIGDPGALAQLMRLRGPFTHIVQLAAVVGVRCVLADPEGTRTRNLLGMHGLLQALRLSDRSLPRVLSASSSEVYAEQAAPLCETSSAVRSEALGGRFAYAASKLAGERLLDDHFADHEHLRPGPVHLRFFNVVGPSPVGPGQDARQGMVFPRFCEAVREDRAPEVIGDGRAVRTFAHVAEVARCLADLVELPDADLPAGPLNIGGLATTDVLGLVAAFGRALGHELAARHVLPHELFDAPFEEVRRRVPDLTRLRATGVRVPELPLDALVEDMLARHISPPGRAEQSAAHAGGRTGAHAVATSCASPAF